MAFSDPNGKTFLLFRRHKFHDWRFPFRAMTTVFPPSTISSSFESWVFAWWTLTCTMAQG